MKLIEVALPPDDINAESACEKSIREERNVREVAAEHEGKSSCDVLLSRSPGRGCRLQLVLDHCGENLTRGTTLVDESDPGIEPRVLAPLEHAIRDGRKYKDGENRLAGASVLALR